MEAGNQWVKTKAPAENDLVAEALFVFNKPNGYRLVVDIHVTLINRDTPAVEG